jgi:hypothetical protein
MKRTAEEFGCCEATVWKILQSNDVKRFGVGGFDAASVDHDFFARIDEQAFYFAGLLMADGCIDRKRNRVRLGLRSRDRSIVDELVKRSKYEGNVPEYLNKSDWHTELCVYSKKWKSDLACFGVVPNKTDVASIPQWVKDHTLYRHYLRGVFDGDGSLRHGSYRVDGTPSRFQMTVVGSVGVVTSFENECKLVTGKSGKVSQRVGTDVWRWELGDQRVIKPFAGWLYAGADTNLWITRKKQMADIVISNVPRRSQR